MGNKPYTPPVVEDTAKVEEAPVAAVAAVAEPTLKEPTLAPEVLTIDPNGMTNAKGTAATAILIDRIQRHFDFLAGKKTFPTKEERDKEQISFIETIGNSIKLDYPQFVLVVEVLINAIKANQTIFDNGEAFRFIHNMEKGYPPQYIAQYQRYLTFLATLAKNWSIRYKLAKLVDPAYVIKDMDNRGKQNVTQYFRALCAS